MTSYAAESMINMTVPAGTPTVPVFGQYIPSIHVGKAIELGVEGATGLNPF